MSSPEPPRSPSLPVTPPIPSERTAGNRPSDAPIEPRSAVEPPTELRSAQPSLDPERNGDPRETLPPAESGADWPVRDRLIDEATGAAQVEREPFEDLEASGRGTRPRTGSRLLLLVFGKPRGILGKTPGRHSRASSGRTVRDLVSPHLSHAHRRNVGPHCRSERLYARLAQHLLPRCPRAGRCPGLWTVAPRGLYRRPRVDGCTPRGAACRDG